MDDHTLLLKAAKAAQLRLIRWDEDGQAFRVLNDAERTFSLWNPLTDDGDALRLSVALEMDIGQMLTEACVTVTAVGPNDDVYAHDVPWGTDPTAATRRAIVLVAADMGIDGKGFAHG
jgi:hypothetical protein